MEKWYDGTGDYYFPSPTDDKKVKDFDKKTNSILTYISTYLDYGTYLTDLKLSKDSFKGMKVADIGCGPLPTTLVFENCDKTYCVDHLINEYKKLGYPQGDVYKDVSFVNAKSERMPFDSNFLDAVISVNALDHVDDFSKTANEIKRVLRKDGQLHLLINCHKTVTSTEPLALSEDFVLDCFKDIDNFRVINKVEKGYGFKDGETILFSNRK